VSTTLTRWRPFEDFGDLRTRLDRLFEDMVGEGNRRDWTAAVDIVRDKDKLVLRADMPGIKPDDVKIEVRDDILTVSGKHEEEKEEQNKDYVRRERRYGSFSRSIALPAGVDADRIDATCKDGVLEVTIPMPEEKEPKAVEVKPRAA
jgi:HSP20 family protein